ncbi:MAG: phosphoenolpyruvate--protein phosphotransferase, partial [Kiritimatiellia bacterium]|nr:phosphoenolpyruvate--protein phosphotransferase [Kiritimatiellia bacterium]
LKDRSFTDPIRESLRKGQSAQDAILDVFGVYERMLQNSRNPRIREKSVDLEDVTHRLMGNLLEVSEQELNYENRIAIARNMTPSEILKLAAQKVAGLVLLEGGFGAHVAILARSIRIPLLVVSDPAILRLKEEDFLILDAEQGSLCIRPTAEVIAEYNRMEKDRAALAQTPAPDPGPAHTREGERIHLLANMNLLSDLPLIHQSGAEGIGLYRSEFPFLVRDNFPSEEEQTRIYRTIVEGMGGKPITFRTLDIGGDKTPGYMRGTLEANPVLGVRAIRFSLKNEPIFKQQIRAMLRATHDAELRMMFPMISSLDELREVRRIVRECEEELRRDGFSANQNPKIGIMVEVPAAAECIVELTDEVDFMSIGSNDLIQYILAVDRTNPAVADLYQSSHPAVLRAVARIVAAARDKNREISLCGDMAGELRMIPFLIGIGLRRLSVEPGKMNEIRTRIREISAREGENLAKRVLSAASCAETARCLAMK